MLSASLHISTASSATNNSVVNPAVADASVVANTPAAVTAEKDTATETQTELFSGQLDEVFTRAEAAAPSANIHVSAEQTLPTEQLPSQSGVEHLLTEQPITEPQPNAEQWLQTMLDQQQLQLQTRDGTEQAAVTVNGVMPATIDLKNTTSDSANLIASVVASVQNKSVGGDSITGAAVTDGAVTEELVDKNTNAKTAVANTDVIKSAFAKSAAEQTAEADVKNNRLENAGASDKPSAVSEKPSAVKNISTPDVHTVEPGNNPASTPASTAQNATRTALASFAKTMMAETTASDSLTAVTTTTGLATANTDTAQRSAALTSNLQAPTNAFTQDAKWGEQLLHTLRDNVQLQIQQKIQNATIRLDPPELGSLEIYLSHEGGRLQIQITASQADVARLIQQTSDRLRQELSGAQFTQVNIQTSADGQQGQQQSRERQRFVSDEMILANEQHFVGDDAKTQRSSDVLVSV